ncbi:MAG TPA: cofactor-independent phosphoglycerate mutase [Candidatus Avimonoglobus intestinipullorum]|uniref:Cofactor-independent phosphoglycerate mutase n=1 Tax=Candidatus Avimonoglobus intestinipullorum TaxID=2840699 RepID=A0A9D1LVN1_9FIRM|nr:cofactor-independent phosphoglycerate mutase [Candidatus Avimonoglobus intestinipullorum]
MKYIVVLGDGMADEPIDALGGKTVLEAAHKPHMDYMAAHGELGLVRTVLDGMKPGSDVANLSVMGYDTRKCYTGRSPLEAASIGVRLKDTDVTFRANLVTLSDEERYEDKTMVDYSAGEISTEEARELIGAVEEALHTDALHFHAGVSYRHLLVWDGGSTNVNLTPPHDISDRKITEYLPKGEGAEQLLELMKKSERILKEHPVNQKRIAAGKRPATSIWIWGEGTKPKLDDFYGKFGKKGSVISAVDLIKGIAICAGMESIDVEGATGNYDTNFEGKAKAALDALMGGSDFVYIHLEAPDECGHQGDVEHKVQSVEWIDEKVIGYLRKELERMNIEYKMMVLPDHPTPIRLKTHVSNPVPYLIYNSAKPAETRRRYTEKEAEAAGRFIAEGHRLMEHFFEN